MITHIDLGAMLRRTVCELYSDLVTRPTGAAVRTGIEQQLAELAGRTLTVIDFSRVGLLDFSCADEIVAKLLVRCQGWGGDRPHDAYFLLAGIRDLHIEPIEAVLERRALAVVAQPAAGHPDLLGSADGAERVVWAALDQLGRGTGPEIALVAGMAPADAEPTLESLCDRRVIMRDAAEYIALGAVARP
ncbi:MAG TPA: hypothetical protein VK922_08710 [Gemmatimonadaceae bacterium]|nr:hypothetical protein [Gemmatimonadaceae bacterium]